MSVSVYLYNHAYIYACVLILVNRGGNNKNTVDYSPTATICLSIITVCLVCHNVWPELHKS